jgi:hypothetical protein
MYAQLCITEDSSGKIHFDKNFTSHLALEKVQYRELVKSSESSGYIKDWVLLNGNKDFELLK